MGRLINAHGAGVDHRMGDGIMVLFNDPLPCDDPAGDAVGLAIAMRARMAELCLQWKRLGHRLGFGVGVSLGYATVGMVGFEGRFDYTASGTAINLASRLCDEANDGEILLSPRARIAVGDRFPVVSRGELNLKGIRGPVKVFKLTGIAAACLSGSKDERSRAARAPAEPVAPAPRCGPTCRGNPLDCRAFCSIYCQSDHGAGFATAE